MLRTVKRCAYYLMDTSVFLFGSGLINLLKHLSHPTLQSLGHKIGSLAFYTVPNLRKTALTNLALAYPHLPYHERYLLATTDWISF